jgi:hypothetical protein
MANIQGRPQRSARRCSREAERASRIDVSVSPANQDVKRGWRANFRQLGTIGQKHGSTNE